VAAVTGAVLAGAVAGLGVYLLIRVFVRPGPGIAVAVARLDAGRRPHVTPTAVDDQPAGSPSPLDRLRRTLGRRLEAEAVARGWRLDRLRVDLAVMGRGLAPLFGTKALLAAGALIWVPLLWLGLRLLSVPVPPATPALFSLLAAAFAFMLPDFALRSEAARRRKDFRHVVGCFLDLVAMNLAGGRGLPEALLAASSVGDHWAMARIRQALANARLIGSTPWEALSRLGDEIGLEELRDLGGALTLAADDGAKVRASLSARAASLRRKELAEAEGQAGERSESMLIAQLLICTSFLVFLAYPATYRILHS
jgi:Flp pilus assembly protein TadB